MTTIDTAQDSWYEIQALVRYKSYELQKGMSSFITNYGKAIMAMASPCCHGYIDLEILETSSHTTIQICDTIFHFLLCFR